LKSIFLFKNYSFFKDEKTIHYLKKLNSFGDNNNTPLEKLINL
jgi:hypothetical protein